MATELTVGITSGDATTALITDYSVVEDSTPLVGGDSSGGVGQIKVDFAEFSPEDTAWLYGTDVVLADDERGVTTGTITDLSGGNGAASLSGTSRLHHLIGEVVMPAMAGTLAEVVEDILTIAGVQAGFVVDPSIAARPIVLPAYSGDMWNLVKMLCVAQTIEVALVSNNIVFRPVRQRVAQTLNVTDESWSISAGSLAQNVAIWNYNASYINSIVYPIGAERVDAQIFTVGSAETNVYDVDTSVGFLSNTSVEQPMVVDNVYQDYAGDASVYSVRDKDDVTVTAGQWVKGGGFMTVEVLPDLRTLRFTIGGMFDDERAPFSISGGIAGNEPFSAVRISGEGVVTTRQLLTLPTGVPASDVVDEVGITIDNPWVSNIDIAYTVGGRAAAAYAKPAYTYNVTSKSIQLGNDSGSRVYGTFADFDAHWDALNATATFLDFDNYWNGVNASATFDTFDLWADTQFASDFTLQEFGNVAGSRVSYRDNMFRVRGATITPAAVQANAESDLTLADFDTVWAGTTFADFDAVWTGSTHDKFSLTPLRR